MPQKSQYDTTGMVNDPEFYSMGDNEQHQALMHDPDYAAMSPDDQNKTRDQLRQQHGIYSSDSTGQSPAGSTPGQSNWYDPIVSAYKWATSPFQAVQQTVGTPEQEQKTIQHAVDVDAMKTPPDQFSRSKEYLKAFTAGTAGDVARDLGSPASVAAAAAGSLGEVPGVIGKAVKWANRLGGAALAAKGAYDAATAAPKAVQQVKQGGYLPAAATMSGPAAEVAGGATMAMPGPHAKTPTEEQIFSLDHDMAAGTQKYVRDFATKEKIAAGADLAALDQQVDAAHPSGVVDGRGILDKYEPQRNAMFPKGAGGEPTGPMNRLNAAAGTPPNVQSIEAQVNAPGSQVTSPTMWQLQSEIAGGKPLSSQLLQDLRDQGVEIPEEPRPWTMAESRQIQNSIMGLAKRMARSNPKGARLLTLIGKEIADQREAGASSIGLGDEFLARNARYEHYMNTFEEGPLRNSIRGKNANQILDPLTGPNREVIRRQLAEYGDQIDHKSMLKAAQTHGVSKAISHAAPGEMRNRILAAGGMVAVGNAIGHPFLGLIGASSVGREALMNALEKRGFAAQAGETGIPFTAGKFSVPQPEVPSLLRRAIFSGTKGAAAGAGATAEQNQSYPLQPTHVHPGTGQRIAWDSRRQAYIDVDTGQPLVTH